MKKCTKCLVEKGFWEFGSNCQTKDLFNHRCKDCRNEAVKKRRKDNPDLYEELLKKNRDRHRKKIGISLDAPPNCRAHLKDGPPGHINHFGYRVIHKKGHPNAEDSKGKIAEHRYVMSEKLGRTLAKTETVHHLNGIRTDNRKENLELWDRRHGPGQRVEDKVKWCIEFLNEYGYDVTKRPI